MKELVGGAGRFYSSAVVAVLMLSPGAVFDPLENVQ